MRRRPENIEDELLVLSAQAGDRSAIGQLFQRWRVRHWRHARTLCPDEASASDAMQEAWLAIVRQIGRLDDPARFAAWAYRIVTHKCADAARRSSRERRHTRRHAQGQRDVAPPSEGDPDGLRLAHASLPAEQRALLALFYVDGLAVRQIAVALAIPEGTVKSRLHQARALLRAAVQATKLESSGAPEVPGKETVMDDIDRKIREALTDQDKELFDELSDELGLFDMVAQSFRGKMGWLTVMVWAWTFVTFAGAIVSAVQFFGSTDVKAQIMWAVACLMFMMMTGMLKMYAWMEMHRAAVTREIKRVELQIARLAWRLEDR